MPQQIEYVGGTVSGEELTPEAEAKRIYEEARLGLGDVKGDHPHNVDNDEPSDIDRGASGRAASELDQNWLGSNDEVSPPLGRVNHTDTNDELLDDVDIAPQTDMPPRSEPDADASLIDPSFDLRRSAAAAPELRESPREALARLRSLAGKATKAGLFE